MKQRLMWQCWVWAEHHIHSCTASFRRIVQRPWATLMTVSVMAMAIILPLALSILLANLKGLTGSLQQSRDINVFCQPALPMERTRALAHVIEHWPDVALVQFRSPEQGLAELQARMQLDSLVAAIGNNPLPALLIIRPTDGANDQRLAIRLRALPEVSRVQYDAIWHKRLEDWLGLGRRLVQALWILFGLGVILVVGNTVRLDIQSRQEEIYVLQLLGAHNRYVRRPFVYLGALYGLFSGGLALFILQLVGASLQGPIQRLAERYGSHFTLQGPNFIQNVAILVMTLLLGWLGSWLVTGYFLRQMSATNSKRLGV